MRARVCACAFINAISIVSTDCGRLPLYIQSAAVVSVSSTTGLGVAVMEYHLAV